MLPLDECIAGELCEVAISVAHALVQLPIGQMPEALIIPSIMLRRGQNGMNAMSSSYNWMRQRRKRRAACRSSLQPAYLGRKSIARIAETLESQFVEIAENQPEVLARHFAEAGLSETAIQYWSRAGERTLQRSANAEAAAHLTSAIALVCVSQNGGGEDASN